MKTQGLLKSLGNFNYSAPKLSDSVLVTTSERIRAQLGFDNVTEPSRYSIEEVRLKLLAISKGEAELNILTKKEHRLCPWAFFSIDDKQRLVDDREFFKLYMQYVIERKQYQSLSNWLHVFMLYYPTAIASFEILRLRLNELLIISSGIKAQRLKDWVGGNALLETVATKLFGQSCLSIGVRETFEKYRLSSSLETGQFAITGLQQLLTILSSTFAHQDENKQQSILNSLFSQLMNSEEFKYPALRSDLADGLLQSFLGNSPSNKIKKRLKNFFIKHYGDIRTEKSKWVGVSEEAKKVMQQWMVENTLHDFFALLTHVARYDSTADRHWEYRKRFWNAYLKKGVISEAWVALGPMAHYEAKQFLKGDKNVYASLSGAQSRHSSLIMIIDGILITEWSHSGRYRVWDSDYNRPRLYKKKYHRDELVTGNDYEGNHSASDTGGWQYTLSTLINDLTGIRVTSREYMND
ncbi:EH signature domain-containing protein [Shewanella insulae]|uniref:EH signature domain-containing protein n=1 Tax=Shewanella insulae TaxID=2681496 RepID=UPI001EFEC139|nr:EH signature domain-containing protein [Shewanella insulae]MCG9714953.1 EH signature domain-containing protein [Shewanella insulae]